MPTEIIGAGEYKWLQTLEGKFFLRWKDAGGPTLRREYKWHEERKFRFDFSIEDQDGNVLTNRIAIEVEGGQSIYGGGRHQRSEGFERDCIKYNLAARMGWRVFRLTSSMAMDDKYIKELVEFLNDLGLKAGDL